MRSLLNEQERLFAIGYMHEQLYGGGGFATRWIEEHGIPHGDMQPFALHFSRGREVNEPLPPKPEKYPVPWTSVEEFRRRSAELRETLHEQPQAQVEDNADPGSTEEPGDTER